MGGGDGGGAGGGREGDWECNGCRNRNYAFRSFCNRCKQPRLLVDTKTPADSKWLPRIGDWICTGCTNNNYASREKCKKCGQPKEVAAMPATAIPGASLPTHPNYFARAQGGAEQHFNMGLLGSGAIRQPLPFTSNWSLVGTENYGSFAANGYGFQSASPFPLAGSNISGVTYASQTSQPITNSNGWRNGDWICSCGFHNYSSREQCKKCNAPMPSTASAPSSLASTTVTALGTKRLASEELVHNWDNKRLNAGHNFVQPYQAVESSGNLGVHLPSSLYPTFPTAVSAVPPIAPANLSSNVYSTFPSAAAAVPPNVQVNLQVPHVPAVILGKGAKQWRSGDWMCTNCSNHNYASRTQCNRCKTQREVPTQPVTVA